MADPSTYRPAPRDIPDAPGVYRFRDASGRVIYVGKAKSLRSRLGSYFADLSSLHPRTRQMVTTASGVDWTVVATEVEALQLEYTWIKEFDPRFNVRYRDDKSYPVLAVTMHEEYPRPHVYRGPRKKGVRYFGPYAHAWAIRETLDLLLRVFPARTCSNTVFRRHTQIGRPCLLGYIGKCSAPCVGRVNAEEHRTIVQQLCEFLSGRTDNMVRELERDMNRAAEDLDFERAARLRDDVAALRKAMEKQSVVFGDGTDADVVAFAHDELQAAVQVFHVRGGRVRGQRGWVVDVDEAPVDDADGGEHAASGAGHEAVGADREEAVRAQLVTQFLTQFYGQQAELAEQVADSGPPVPKHVLVPTLPADVDALARWLSELRGSRVRLRVPQRGDKRALADTVARNASEALAQHKLRRAGDLTARSAALSELQEQLGLDTAPLRIECVDVSHIQGSDVVASLVVFEDGVPRKSEYKRFSIKQAASEGDVAAIAEVVRRRFARYVAESSGATETGEPGDSGETSERAGVGGAVGSGEPARPAKFAYPPNLLVVDGAGPQATAAADALADHGVTDVAVVGLAKRLEEVWLPGEPDPVILPRSSEALYLLQRVRDEAHRFAVRYHRTKRSRRVQASELDSVPGLGQARKAALIKHFGSVKKLKQATVEEIAGVRGVGRHTAEVVHAALHGIGGPAGGTQGTRDRQEPETR
ncbi:excinuclease ABC subunit UvrC [Haloechinothrix sp. LS1_15]|uniref:excinuclease ABC subunit UvrC n=1 Tax=Haloechinothrix sp. LS1_15 TaxID=2652248 RepID=UPI0029474E55|nr:excinuclease ABC subunit UvrC [Haloechinothrix sp. LS1_15]MDV6013247.1 excinuclease ABC subunit UvrC [Haloechinothrix sp. LS1_15]